MAQKPGLPGIVLVKSMQRIHHHVTLRQDISIAPFGEYTHL